MCKDLARLNIKKCKIALNVYIRYNIRNKYNSIKRTTLTYKTESSLVRFQTGFDI